MWLFVLGQISPRFIGSKKRRIFLVFVIDKQRKYSQFLERLLSLVILMITLYSDCRIQNRSIDLIIENCASTVPHKNVPWTVLPNDHMLYSPWNKNPVLFQLSI